MKFCEIRRYDSARNADEVLRDSQILLHITYKHSLFFAVSFLRRTYFAVSFLRRTYFAVSFNRLYIYTKAFTNTLLYVVVYILAFTLKQAYLHIRLNML